MKDISKKIGDRIREFRKASNLSQERLALEAGLNPAFLGHIERGLKCPTIDTLSKISSALNISLSELVNIDNITDISNSKLSYLINQLSPQDTESVIRIISEIIKIKSSD